MKGVQRGDIFWAKLDPVVGHEQGGTRPVLVVSDPRLHVATGNVFAMALTTRDKFLYPLQVDLGVVGGRVCFALPGQLRTISVARVGKRMGRLSEQQVERCLDAVSLLCGRRLMPAQRASNDPEE